MGILDSVKNMAMKTGLIEETPDSLQAPKPAPVATQTQVATPIAQPVVVAPIVLTSNDAEYAQVIQDALKESSTEPMDFMKFRLAVDALAKLVPDEASRYATAFATSAATAGATAETILATAGKFLNTIEEVKVDFTANVIGAMNADIDTKMREVDGLMSEMDSISAQITALTEKQNELSFSRLTKQNELTSMREKIEIDTRNFESAIYKETDKLNKHKVCIEKYLLGKV